MIRSQLNSNNEIELLNYGNEMVDGYYYFLNLDDNLCFTKGFVVFHPGQWVSIGIGAWNFDVGVQVKLCDKQGNIVHSNDIWLSDKTPRFYFSSPYNQLTYGSWYSLIEQDEYKGLFDINEDDVVYDLGANIGAFTQWVNHKYPYKHIYAFEPTPELVPHLNKTFAGNEKITIFDKAVSDINQTEYFNLFNDSVSNTFLDYKFIDEDQIKGKIEVQGVNLEQFIDENSLLAPTFIKMDIEAAEYRVMDSLSDKFLSQLRILLLEYHTFEYEQEADVRPRLFGIIKRMLDLGFAFDIKTGNSLREVMGTLVFYKI